MMSTPVFVDSATEDKIVLKEREFLSMVLNDSLTAFRREKDQNYTVLALDNAMCECE